MTKHCVLAAADIKNADANSDNIILQLFLQFQQLKSQLTKIIQSGRFFVKS